MIRFELVPAGSDFALLQKIGGARPIVWPACRMRVFSVFCYSHDSQLRNYLDLLLNIRQDFLSVMRIMAMQPFASARQNFM